MKKIGMWIWLSQGSMHVDIISSFLYCTRLLCIFPSLPTHQTHCAQAEFLLFLILKVPRQSKASIRILPRLSRQWTVESDRHTKIQLLHTSVSLQNERAIPMRTFILLCILCDYLGTGAGTQLYLFGCVVLGGLQQKKIGQKDVQTDIHKFKSS